MIHLKLFSVSDVRPSTSQDLSNCTITNVAVNTKDADKISALRENGKFVYKFTKCHLTLCLNITTIIMEQIINNLLYFRSYQGG